MLKITVDDYKDISLFLKSEKDTFFKAIIKEIKNGWKNNIDKVGVAEFLVSKSEVIISVDIEKKDWEESLYLALYHYEDTEEYEKCIEVKGLISDIFGQV